MGIFTRLNRKSIADRQIDTLLGLSKGLIAGKVDQAEAEFLMAWLVQNRQATDNPIIINLLDRVGAMLRDGVRTRWVSAIPLPLVPAQPNAGRIAILRGRARVNKGENPFRLAFKSALCPGLPRRRIVVEIGEKGVYPPYACAESLISRSYHGC